MDPADDNLPIRFIKESFSKGHAKDVLIKKEDFEKSLKEYYALRGWNEKGIPTPEKLKELGLSKFGKILN
jgi:aldehyde:ferredoxin oxidoreductase